MRLGILGYGHLGRTLAERPGCDGSRPDTRSANLREIGEKPPRRAGKGPQHGGESRRGPASLDMRVPAAAGMKNMDGSYDYPMGWHKRQRGWDNKQGCRRPVKKNLHSDGCIQRLSIVK